MDDAHRQSALVMRHQLASSGVEPARFRASLLGVSPHDRDAWIDLVLGLDDIPDDDPALPRGCVPYLPCSVDAVLQIAEHASVMASDVFVDVGSGAGRAMAVMQLITGAGEIGLEVQPTLVARSRELARRLGLDRVQVIEGDAVETVGSITAGSVFLLYCPFSGERLTRFLASLEVIAQTRQIWVCCLDLPLPPTSWLTLMLQPSEGLSIYRAVPPS